MGCCVSCRREGSSNSAPPTHRHSLEFSNGSREPPIMEEEMVKEVLSVTTTSKPILQLNQEKQIQMPVLEEIERDDGIEKMISVVEERSVVSEICSLSESISAASVTDKADGEVSQKLNRSPATFHNNRSFASDQVLEKDRLVGKSPTRRSDQYTPRRHGGSAAPVRIVENIDSSSGMGRRCPRAELHRRDRGENSAQRSRSPATAPGATRSSPARSGRSPGRAAIPPPETQKEAEEINSNDVNYSPDATNESLENPLVSLECFIFL